MPASRAAASAASAPELRAQPVIDDQPEHGAAARHGPFAREKRQRQAVGAAGNRHRECRRRLERTERSDPRGEFAGVDRRLAGGRRLVAPRRRG